VFFWFGSKANYTKANTWYVASFSFFFIHPYSTVPFWVPLVSVVSIAWLGAHHRAAPCAFVWAGIWIDNDNDTYSRIHRTHKKTHHRLHAHLDILEKQFSRPTATGGRDNAALTSDGYTDFFAFSTGRRTIASLHTVFSMRPRHDFLQFAYQFLWGLGDLLYSPKDDVTLDFMLHSTTAASVPEFVWALVAKGEANLIKKDRWDLVSQCSLFFFFLPYTAADGVGLSNAKPI
jgi:hypothetical protein